MVLAGTRNDTEYTAIVTQLRSAWDDQDLRERDRGGKSFGKGRTVHFAEADTEWYAEQITHTASLEMHLSWRRLGPSILLKPSGGVVCWTRQFLNLT